MSRSLLATFIVVIGIIFAACAPKPYAPKEVQAIDAPFQSEAEKLAVARMRQAGITAQDWRDHSDGGICKLHAMKMETITVPRLRGEVHYDHAFYDVRERFFPNAGIIYGKDLFSKQEMGHIYICPKCITAGQAWSKEKG